MAALVVVCVGIAAPDAADGQRRLHFAPNGNFDADGAYLPGRIGFNLADVSSPGELDRLPTGVGGLAWVGQCDGVDAAFVTKVQRYLGKRNLWGFYLMDDPDPRAAGKCSAAQLRAEADWIHQNMPRARTFIVLMNLGSSKAPSFSSSFTAENSHVDLFGFSPYPCRSELNACDFEMIDRYVAAVLSSGVTLDRIVPVYQAFGGGHWLNDAGGRYVMPTASQEEQILGKWAALVPQPVFDFAYSWGTQRDDISLQHAADLQAVFARHNKVD